MDLSRGFTIVACVCPLDLIFLLWNIDAHTNFPLLRKMAIGITLFRIMTDPAFYVVEIEL